MAKKKVARKTAAKAAPKTPRKVNRINVAKSVRDPHARLKAAKAELIETRKNVTAAKNLVQASLKVVASGKALLTKEVAKTYRDAVGIHIKAVKAHELAIAKVERLTS